jgi:K+ potassium transporter
VLLLTASAHLRIVQHMPLFDGKAAAGLTSILVRVQAITQGFFPRFTVTHTSREHSGQIFIATVNYTCAGSSGFELGHCWVYICACRLLMFGLCTDAPECKTCRLMTLTIIITVAFRTSARLSEAYGALKQAAV